MNDIRKLLFVSDAPHFGGAERYVANMVAAAASRGIASAVCWMAPADSSADVFAEAGHRGAVVRIVPASRTRNLLASARELRAVIRSEQPDAIIANACGRPGFWSVPWVARLSRVPALWVHHMVDHWDYRRLAPSRLGGRVQGLNFWRWPQALRHKLAAMTCSGVITLNEEDRAQVVREHGLRPYQVHVVGNGIDTHQYRFDLQARRQTRAAWAAAAGWAGEPFVIGSAGRLIHGKGMELLIQAASLLQRQAFPARIVIAGEGPDRVRLQSITTKLGLTNVIRFLGHEADMPAFYSGLDAFVLCSSTESFGLVLAEAMACGRAVVATPTAGARMQIEQERNGLLMNAFSAGDLVDRLVRLQADAHLREQLGRHARRRVVQNFSMDVALSRTLAVLGHALPSCVDDCDQALHPLMATGMEEAA